MQVSKIQISLALQQVPSITGISGDAKKSLPLVSSRIRSVGGWRHLPEIVPEKWVSVLLPFLLLLDPAGHQQEDPPR